MRRALDQARQQNPEATYSTIANQFGPILESLIDERALLAFAADHGFVLSKRLVDAEIANLPQTRGLDGKFSEQAYAGLPPAAADDRCRRPPPDRRSRLPSGWCWPPPRSMRACRSASPGPMPRCCSRQREGQMALVPADAFRAGLNPSDGDLQSFYAQNRQRYMVAGAAGPAHCQDRRRNRSPASRRPRPKSRLITRPTRRPMAAAKRG